jgi:hypothetical protein
MRQPDPRDFSRGRLARSQGEQSRQGERPHVLSLDSQDEDVQKGDQQAAVDSDGDQEPPGDPVGSAS